VKKEEEVKKEGEENGEWIEEVERGERGRRGGRNIDLKLLNQAGLQVADFGAHSFYLLFELLGERNGGMRGEEGRERRGEGGCKRRRRKKRTKKGRRRKR